MLHTFNRAALVLLVASLLLACSKPVPTEEPVRSVKVISVTLGALKSGTEFAGEVRARVESRLGFRVAGKIVRRDAELGQHIKAGAILAQLDPQDYQLAAQAAQAQVTAAATNQALADADLKRFKELREQNFISGAELERREATLKASQAQLDQARSQAAAQTNQAGYTKLVADASGVVTSVDAEPGQVVAAGTPVLRIAHDGPREVFFSVPEDQVARLKVGSKVAVRSWGSGTESTGLVREVAATSDPVTRTYGVKVTLDTKDPPPLGSTVTVRPQALQSSGAMVIKLPTSAVRQDGTSAAVWLLDTSTMTVRVQTIDIATVDGNEVVVRAGLQPGMLVVSAGVHALSPGQKVSLYKPREPSAPQDVSAAPAMKPAVASSAASQ